MGVVENGEDMNFDTQNQAPENISSPVPKKKAYKGWSLKRRWPMAVLGGVVLPFTLFMGAFEWYAGGYDMFRFSLSDFAPVLAIWGLLVALLLTGILLLLRGRAFDVTLAVLASVALMANVQKWINVNTSLVGDDVGVPVSPVWKVINLILWIMVIVGCVLAVLLVKKRKWLRYTVTLVLVVMMGMQIPNFIVLSVTTDVYKPKDMTVDAAEMSTQNQTSVDASSETSSAEQDPSEEDDRPKVLTVKNLYTVGSEKNVVVFLIDRYDIRYVDEVKEHDPDYFDAWEDFVYYEDNITAFSRTYPAVGSMLSGKNHDFKAGVSAADYFYDAYQNSPLLQGLKEADFSINIYTDEYYAYRDAREFLGYADNISGVHNYTVQERESLCVDMLGLAVYSCVPEMAKMAFSALSTDRFEKYVKYDTGDDDEYALRDADIYAGLVENGLTVGEHENHFAFVHLSGIHSPYKIDADGGPSKSKTSLGATLGCMKLVRAYIDELKRLGLYEDTTIIITGDHPDPISDDVLPDKPRLTALFVKRAGVSGQPFTESQAQVGQNNLIPSILSAAGVSYDASLGECYWDIPEGEDRVRTYHFLVNPTAARNEFWMARYSITGNGRDFANWHVEDTPSLNGSMYR